MLEDNKDFDLQIRSIMQDAEEIVPPQAWDAISAKLDVAASSASGSEVVGKSAYDASGAAELKSGESQALTGNEAIVAESSHENIFGKWWKGLAIGLTVAAAVTVGIFVLPLGNDRYSGNERIALSSESGFAGATDGNIEADKDKGEVVKDNVDGVSADHFGRRDAGVETAKEVLKAVAEEEFGRRIVSSEQTNRIASNETGIQTNKAAGNESAVSETENIAAETSETQTENSRIASNNIETSVSSENGKTDSLNNDDLLSESETSAGKSGNGSEVNSDPFAQMEWEDAQSKHSKMVLSFGSDLGSNGNPDPTFKRGEYRSKRMSAPTRTTIQNSGTNSSYTVPLTVGIGVKFYLTERIAVGTGIDYSVLGRKFFGKYTQVENGVETFTLQSNVHNTLHYVGIPLNVSYNIIAGDKINFYTHAGAEVEKAVSNHYVVDNSPNGNISYHEKVNGVQTSVDLGIGVEFKIVDSFRLYIDPSLKYYFESGQPISIRTQQPLMLNCSIGMRFAI